jgi:hypothetical protein
MLKRLHSVFQDEMGLFENCLRRSNMSVSSWECFQTCLNLHLESLKLIFGQVFKDLKPLEQTLQSSESSRKASAFLLMYLGDVERYKA